MPVLTITETGDRIRLQLGGFARGEGASLQEAADDLICSVLRLAAAVRYGGCGVSSEVRPDLDAIGFLHELGDIAAAGGDIRELVFAS
jgi:hypothetical protein